MRRADSARLDADNALQAPARLMGLRTDLALAMALAGRYEEAVAAIAAAAHPLFDIREELVEPTFSTWQRLGEAARMIAEDAAGETPFDHEAMARAVGMCSSLEPLDWSTATPAPSDVILFYVARLDVAVRAQPDAALALEGRLRLSPLLVIQAISGGLLFDLAVVRNDFSRIVGDAVGQVVAMVATAGDGPRDPTETFDAATALPPPPDRLEFIHARVIAALFRLAEGGVAATAPWDEWRRSLPENAAFALTRELIDWSQRVFVDDPSPWNWVFPAPPTWEAHVVAALAAACRQPLSPDQLIACHALWMNYLRRPLIGEITAEPAASMVSRQWLERCRNPAQLVTPRLTVPAIEAAAANPTGGWTRVRAVVAAASDAVSAQSRRFAAVALATPAT